MAKLSIVPEVVKLTITKSSGSRVVYLDFEGKNFQDSIRIESQEKLDAFYAYAENEGKLTHPWSQDKQIHEIDKTRYSELRKFADE